MSIGLPSGSLIESIVTAAPLSTWRICVWEKHVPVIYLTYQLLGAKQYRTELEM